MGVAATICDSYLGIGHNFLLFLVKNYCTTINAIFPAHLWIFAHLPTFLQLSWQCNSTDVVQFNFHSSCPLPTNVSLVLMVTGEEEGSCKICFCQCQWSFTRGYLLWEHWAIHSVHYTTYTRYCCSGPGPGECWGLGLGGVTSRASNEHSQRLKFYNHGEGPY